MDPDHMTEQLAPLKNVITFVMFSWIKGAFSTIWHNIVCTKLNSKKRCVQCFKTLSQGSPFW